MLTYGIMLYVLIVHISTVNMSDCCYHCSMLTRLISGQPYIYVWLQNSSLPCMITDCLTLYLHTAVNMSDCWYHCSMLMWANWAAIHVWLQNSSLPCMVAYCPIQSLFSYHLPDTLSSSNSQVDTWSSWSICRWLFIVAGWQPMLDVNWCWMSIDAGCQPMLDVNSFSFVSSSVYCSLLYVNCPLDHTSRCDWPVTCVDVLWYWLSVISPGTFISHVHVRSNNSSQLMLAVPFYEHFNCYTLFILWSVPFYEHFNCCFIFHCSF